MSYEKSDLKEDHPIEIEQAGDSDELVNARSVMYREDGTPLTIADVTVHYDRPWYRVAHQLRLGGIIFIITLTSTIVGYDGSMMNGLQSLPIWKEDMGFPKGITLGLLTNAGVLGSLAGMFFTSYVNDKWGRKAGLMVGNFWCILGAVLQGVANSFGFYTASRVVMSIAGSFATVAAPALISELSHPNHRAVCTSFYNVCWWLGALLAAGVTYGTKDIPNSYCWKIPSYTQAFFPLVQVIFIWAIPESPRYYIKKGNIQKAREIFLKHHAGGDMSAEAITMVEFEIAEIETALEMEKIQNKSRYIDFFKTKGNRKRFFIVMWMAVMMQCSGNGLISYFLNLVLDSVGISGATQQLKINVALMGYNLALSMVASSVTYLFKRKRLFLVSISCMLSCFVVWTVLSSINEQRNFEDKSLGQGVIAMIFLFNASYDIGLCGLPHLYLTEVLTYSLRAKGLNIFGFSGLLCGIYNGFVNPVAMQKISWRYYIVYCCILACEFPMVYFFFPETYGYSLEEVATVFGDDPQDLNNTISAIRSKSHVDTIV